MNKKKCLAFAVATTLLSLGNPYTSVWAATTDQIKVDNDTVAMNDIDVAYNRYGSPAVTAVNGGELTLSGENIISSQNSNWGANSHGIASQSNGSVILTEGSGITIATNGSGSHGIYADSGGNFTSNGNLNISMNFNGWADAHAITSKNGSVTLGENAVTVISTNNGGMYGLYAAEDGEIVNEGSLQINANSTSEWGTSAIVADNGSVKLGSKSDTTIITSGPGAYGLITMNNGTASSSGQLDITTGGSYAHGMTVETDGKVTLEDASATTIKTSGDGSHGIYANGGSAVLNGELEITTAGANDSHGIAAQNNGQVTFAEGSKTIINTEGYRSHGFFVENGTITSAGQLEISTAAAETSGLFAMAGKISHDGSLKVTTNNTQAHGVYSGGSGTVVDLKGTAAVTTHGDSSHAFFVQGGGELQLDGQVAAITEGTSAHGLSANSGGKITAAAGSLVSVSTEKNNAYGIDAQNGQVDLAGTMQVETKGDGAYGVHAYGASGSVQLENVFVTTAGDGAHGLAANYGGTVSFNGNTKITVAKTDNAYALHATLDNSRIEGQGVIDINGSVYAANGGKIDVTAAAASQLTGDIVVESSGVSDITFSSDALFTGLTSVSGTNSENNLTLGSNSLWNMTGTSSLSSFTNNAVVDMTKDGNTFSTLTVDNLNGNGTFLMDIDGTAVDQSDKIVVNDTFTGSQVLSLQETGGRDSDIEIGQAAVGTVLASVNNGDGVFTADDHEGSLYWERYELGSQANDNTGYTDWYLKAVDVLNPGNNPTTTVKTAMSAGALAYHTWRADDKLMERMGDLRQRGEEEQGAWVRVKGSKLSHDGKFGFENKYTMYEIGYDQVMKKTDAYTRYGGVSMSYSDGSSSYDSGSGDNKNKAISFYMTQVGEKGHYVDVVAKFNHMDTDFTVYDSNSKKITGDFDNTGVSLSAEYGRKNSLSQNGWYVEPQAQMTVGYLGSSSYMSNKVQVDQSGISSVVGRLGFNLGRDIDKKTNFYVKANLLHEFSGSYDVAFTDKFGNRAKLDDDFNDTWFEYGAGVAFQGSKNNYFYLDVERSAGSDTIRRTGSGMSAPAGRSKSRRQSPMVAVNTY